MLKNPHLEKKSLGVLVHPTSLPGGSYCGTFGNGLKDWINLLSNNKIYTWQFLPLTPTDNFGSPYSSPSSFALNPWFLDANELKLNGYIDKSEHLEEFRREGLNISSVKFNIADALTALIGDLLLRKWSMQPVELKQEFLIWLEKNKWVNDYSLFAVLKEEFNLQPWWDWPKEFRDKDKIELDLWKKKNSSKLLIKKLIQWHLHRQWLEIKKFATFRGVKLIGDLPFYVSRDSVDVWSNKSLFSVSEKGELIYQSGVPPDYFSSDGQLWGTPVYKWPQHISTEFDWWKRRFKRQFELVDILRLDHFRALAGFWRVDGKAKNAIDGEWIKSPGKELLRILKNDLKLKTLPIIAEDLGVITEDVNSLRNDFNLPGMKILQFAFDGNEDNPYLPKNITNNNCVVYTGTHDNATSISWWANLEELEKKKIMKEYKFSDNPAWSLIELGMRTNAKLFVAPIQDILCLDDSCRLNKPGTVSDNWKWKCNKSLIELVPYLKRFGNLGESYNRTNVL
tara:strand:- start:51 stop:1577 length:1527 start_codon:yes stop_codon:yes gene_type:complete